MKIISKLFCGGYYLTLMLSLFVLPIEADEIVSDSLVKKEYPILYKTFNRELGKTKSDHVLAVDISGSMKEYDVWEPTKKAIISYIKGIPQGDYLTLIKFGEGAQYIKTPGLVNKSTRKTYIKAIQNLNPNESESDLYEMIGKVVKEINRTGGNSVKNVFLFTDFNEYDKQESNKKHTLKQYTDLSNKLDSRKLKHLDIYALKLKLKEDTEFEDIDKVKKVFSGLEEVSINDPQSNLLINWMERRKGEILEKRLNYLVKNQFRFELKQMKVNAYIENSGNIRSKLSCDTCYNLIDSVSVIKNDKLNFLSQESRPFVANCNGRTKTTIKAKVQPFFNQYDHSLGGENEIKSILSNNVVSPQTHQVIITKKEGIVSCYTAWATGIIVFVIVSYVIYTCARDVKIKNNNVSVSTIKNNGVEVPINSKPFQKVDSYSIGQCDKNLEATVPIDNVNWRITVQGEKNCPGRIWKKPGVYLYLEKGSYANMKFSGGTDKTLKIGQKIYLGSNKRIDGVDINLKEGDITYVVKLR